MHQHTATPLVLAQARRLAHAGVDHDAEPATATANAATTDGGDGRSYTWLKWTAAAVLLIEGLIGVLLPVLLKLTVHAGWLLSLVNCFAGGVFFTFGTLPFWLLHPLATLLSSGAVSHQPTETGQQHPDGMAGCN